MVHLKFVRTADMPAACLPDKVPSEEGEPKAKPDSQSGTGRKAMARLKGLEPLTHCLEGSCSIHLSYGRLKVQVSAKRCLNIILCERAKVKAL